MQVPPPPTDAWSPSGDPSAQDPAAEGPKVEGEAVPSTEIHDDLPSFEVTDSHGLPEIAAPLPSFEVTDGPASVANAAALPPPPAIFAGLPGAWIPQGVSSEPGVLAAVAPSDASQPAAPRYSKLAIASGYVGIIPFTWTFFIFPYAYGKYPPWIGTKSIIISAVLAWVIGIVPSLLCAIPGHVSIRHDRGLRGMGHVWFAYVSCVMVFAVQVAALVHQVIRR